MKKEISFKWISTLAFANTFTQIPLILKKVIRKTTPKKGILQISEALRKLKLIEN